MLTELQKESFSLRSLLAGKKKNFRAADNDELEINQIKSLKIRGKNIVLCRSEAGYFALADKCPHKGTPLSRGVMIENTIVCIRCGTHYDIRTGKKKSGISRKDLETFPVRIHEDGIFVIL